MSPLRTLKHVMLISSYPLHVEHDNWPDMAEQAAQGLAALRYQHVTLRSVAQATLCTKPTTQLRGAHDQTRTWNVKLT